MLSMREMRHPQPGEEGRDYLEWVEGLAQRMAPSEQAGMAMLCKTPMQVYDHVIEGIKGTFSSVDYDFKAKLHHYRAEEKKNPRLTASLKNLNNTSVQGINRAIANSAYPEADCKSTLPHLLLQRCSKIINAKISYKDYVALLRDLTLVVGWEDLLDAAEVNKAWYLKTLCEMKLRQYHDARASLEKATQMLSSLNDKAREKMASLIKKGQEQIKLFEDDNLDYPEDKDAPVPIEISCDNQEFPSLDDSLEVKVIPNRGKLTGKERYAEGRGVVAKRGVISGTILAVEEPILHRATEQEMHSCHHCLKYTFYLLPCPSCASIMFCSLECKDKSLESYHKFECGAGLQALMHGEPSFTLQKAILLPLRKILSHPSSHFKENRSKFNYLKEPKLSVAEFSLDNPYEWDNEDLFWNLMHKADYNTNFVAKLCTRGVMHPLDPFIMASHIMTILEILKYPIPDGDRESVIEAAIHLVGLCRTNSKIIETPNNDVVNDPKDITSEMVVGDKIRMAYTELGFGVFNTVSMFNHCCVPNCELVQLGKKFVVVAQRPIKEGEEATVSYCGHYSQRFRETIPTELGFMCSCLACKYDWQGLASHDRLVTKLRYICAGSAQGMIFFGNAEEEVEWIVRKELEAALGVKRVFVMELKDKLNSEDFVKAVAMNEALFKEYLVYRHWSRLTWSVEEEVKKLKEKQGKKKKSGRK